MNNQIIKLIHEVKQKNQTLQSFKKFRNLLNQSYHEYQVLNMKNFINQIIHNLQIIAKKVSFKLSKDIVTANIFKKILLSINKFSSSLLSICQNIMQFLRQFPKIRLSHHHHASQVIFLALFLKVNDPNKEVTILTTKASFKNWQKYLINQKSNDPQSDLKNILIQSQIKIFFINQFNQQILSSSKHILIFDLMNAEITTFKPLILNLKQTLLMTESLIFYHSHNDDTEIQNLLCKAGISVFTADAAQTYPIQASFIQKDLQIKQKLIQLLKQDSSHPQKQDIIIFYKNQHISNSTAKRYAQKLKQLLIQHQLESYVQFVCQKNEIIQPIKNHIFIAENTNQLLQWNYLYQDALIVVDYGWDANYRMDHEKNCFVESLSRVCLREKTKRLAYVGISKVGKYFSAEEEYSETLDYLQRPVEIMSYVLRMIEFGVSDFLEVQHKRIKVCIKNLINNKIIRKNQSRKYQIIDEHIFRLNKIGVDPIQAKAIRSCLEKEKESQLKTLSTLLIMTMSIINTRGNLRQIKQASSSHASIKPTGVWRKTGYLDSCLEILTKAQIIQTGKNKIKSLSKRNNSKVEDEFIDGFGQLFDVYDLPAPKKLEFCDMKVGDLLQEYFVSEQVFAEIRQKIDDLRQAFKIQQMTLNFDQKLLTDTIEQLTHFIPSCVALFSGSRRLGYRYKTQTSIGGSILPNRQCLMSQLNETPQFIIILRCSQNQAKREILMCNTVSLQSFMSIFGELPNKKSDSLAQHQIQFHGISSSIFKGLYRNNNMYMQKFQHQYKCFIQTNQQMATITIYCSKDQSSKIKSAFQQLIAKIKEKFVNYNKIIHYMGNTNASMTNGGEIKQIIKSNYINKCILSNLDLEVTQEDLEDLFEGFFVLKGIEVLPPQPDKYSKQAIIKFNSQKDYYRFQSYYNQIKYFDRILQVKPILSNTDNLIVEEEKFIDFKWYVWKSHQKAVVIFKNAEHAQKAVVTLKENPLIDGSPIKFSIEKNKIFLQQLLPAVDQIFLQKVFSRSGQIQLIQILKTPIRQPSNQQILIDNLLRQSLNIKNNEQTQDKYKILQIEKLKNGLRKCRVLMKNILSLNTVVGKLNQTENKLGQARLYTQSMFTKPILILYPTAIHLYEFILEEIISKGPQMPSIRYNFKDYGVNRHYVVLSSPFIATLNYISTEFMKRLQPKQIKFLKFNKDIILSDVGISNLIDLEQIYNCKLIVNSIKKSLEVICSPTDFNKISQEINLRVQDQFLYRVSLNTHNYRNLLKSKEKLDQIKIKYKLNLLEIEEYSKTLIFQGNANFVQNALNYMMHLIQSFSKPEEQLINTEVCLICYEEPKRPYRLQNCGHKFCFGCLGQCINSILGDITMFPIKCPHCSIELTIDDLESLIEVGSWPKLINMGVTQYVNKNAQVMSFCYTPGCKQINILKLNSFTCDVCAADYCLQCKQRWHEGQTCEQAKNNVDLLFKKYMEENDVRVCPNIDCKMPIVRTDGCFRVTCTRCNKSMCFKCPADKMIAYNDYNLCYQHLNEAHGGYW